jgi:alpha-D-xyloside xylohydrolase
VRLHTGTTGLPDPAGMLARLKERGLRICVWINPHSPSAHRCFAGAPSTATWSAGPTATSGRPTMAGRDGIVDFTNPAARAGTPTSSGRCWSWASTPSRPTSASGSPPTWCGPTDPTGADAQLLQLPLQLLRLRPAARPARRGEAVLFARSATAAVSSFRCTGAVTASRLRLDGGELRGGLSLAASGFGFWSRPSAASRETGSGRVQAVDPLRPAQQPQPVHGSDSYRVRGCSTRSRWTCCAGSRG